MFKLCILCSRKQAVEEAEADLVKAQEELAFCKKALADAEAHFKATQPSSEEKP